MNALTLRVLHQPSNGGVTNGEPEAWLIPGADVQRWVGELIRWRELPATTAVAVLGRAGQTAVGLVVRSTLVPPAGTMAMPLRLSDGRVFIPRDAVIAPPVTSTELRRLFPAGWIVWLPEADPWVVPLDQLLTVTALIAVPRPDGSAWLPVPLIPAPARLLEIRPGDQVDLGPLFNAELTGIAKDPLGNLPSRAGEPGALGVLGRQMLGGIGRAVGGMISGLGGGALGESIQRAFERFGGHLDPRVMEKRFEALHRLMELLDRDPDTGLQRALPLGGDEQQQPRGIARPGWQLGWQNLDFSLRPRGGGPVDPWILPDELRQQLRQRYVALAQQEVDRGNHRRAAAIYAQLLSDWNAAAQVLEQGGYYREAAALFRERLKQPAEAARCFERGGLLVEAAHAYTDLKQHVAAGRCWRRHGDEERARASFLLEVAACQDAGNLIGAANIFVEHLHDLDGAITLLIPTWPDHPQASAALVLRTRLLIRQGRTPAITALLRELRAVSRERIAAAVPALHAVGIDHPDTDLREEAEDVLRCLIGNANAERPDAELIRAFVPFAARDRQVNEDAGRWLREAQRSVKTLPPARPSLAASGFAAQLNPGERALGLITLTHGVMLFLTKEGHLRIRRITWAGLTLSDHLCEVQLDDYDRLEAFVVPVPGSSERVQAIVFGGSSFRAAKTLPPITLPSTDGWPLTTHVGTLGPLVPNTEAIAPDHTGGWSLVVFSDQSLTLVNCPATGATRRCMLHLWSEEHPTPLIVACMDGCVLAHARTVEFISAAGKAVAQITLEHQVDRLVEARDGSTLALAGPQVVRLVLRNKQFVSEVIADQLPHVGWDSGNGRTVIGFTLGRDLVIGMPQELRVYHPPFTSIAVRVTIAGAPLFIAPTRHIDQILVLDTSGWLREVRLPKTSG